MQNCTLRLVACLLNISEGRSKQVIELVAQSAVSIQSQTQKNSSGIKCPSTVLNVFSDYDYNRSVITIAAPVENIEESVYNACKTAFEHIDLSKHIGGHPRLGSVDLIPIHPIHPSVTLQECGQIAKRIGKRIVESISGTSVFFFGHADIPQCRGLVSRRKAMRWYEGKSGMSYSGIGYDIGMAPSQRYGCTGVGAIPYVTNCNVTIDTNDLDLGRAIAQAIRATSPGGFPGVQAMAFNHEGKIEIACNVEACEVCSNPIQIITNGSLLLEEWIQINFRGAEYCFFLGGRGD